MTHIEHISYVNVEMQTTSCHVITIEDIQLNTH